ncbi:MAG: hypothetical protein A3K10_07740 [Bacteroidetes bacterium RIFCSPLOWO2_12_FULL_31_6]|nr:MAG: hypothetical protein A3K10_07740 [Bacteroidetes bacterium RIFCSPLOWO2_12_FULL_31_6]
MENRSKLLNNHLAKSTVSGIASINDLREKEFNGEALTQKEKHALINFDHYRINELNAITDDRAFHKRYQEIQVMANLGDYTEFLKEKYSI